MKVLDGHSFINLLYLPEMHEKVLEMKEELDAPKPLIDQHFKEYGGTSIELDKYGVEIFYEDNSFFNGTENGVYGNSGLTFTGIIFKKNTLITPPYKITMSDSLDVVCKKLKREQDYDNEILPQKVWKFTRDDNKVFLLYFYFSNNYKNIGNIQLTTYTEAVEKLPLHTK